MALEGFEATEFSHDGAARTVYRRGSGPGVVVMHEIPGITPEVARFARIVADDGFTVYLPHLFGTPNKPLSVGYMLGQMARACIAREFSVLARGESSPITDWLRALCRRAHAECGGPGVGAIGMCLTGNFALSLMVDEAVMAPVLSQPSLPFPLSKSHKRALHLSDADLEVVKKRARQANGANRGHRRQHRGRTALRQLGDLRTAGLPDAVRARAPHRRHPARLRGHRAITVDDPVCPTADRRETGRFLAAGSSC